MSELKKVISTKAIFLITVVSIMGTGIFFLPSVGAEKAGPASILSWVILSLVSVYVSMCFAELTGMFPEAGGVYEFSKQAFGHFWSFMIGWTSFIIANITIAMLIVGAVKYLNPVESASFTLSILNFSLNIPFNVLLSLAFIFIFNYIAYRGMQTSVFMLVTFSLITFSTLFALIIPGLFSMKAQNFTPFFTKPLSSVFLTIFFIAETFFGWETATYLAAETKDGARTMPKILIWSTVTIAVICLLFVTTSIGTIGAESFGESGTPLAEIAISHYGDDGENVFRVLVYLCIIGSVAGWIISSPRLLLGMAQDKLFIPSVARLHPVYSTPGNAIIFQTIISSILVVIAYGSYEFLLSMLIPLVLIVYSAVIFSLVVLRKTMPDHRRTYRAPFGITGPVLTILFLFSLIFFWVLEEGSSAVSIMNLALSFIFAGVPVFFLLLFYFDPGVIMRANDYLAYFHLMFERILFPRKVSREIFKHVGNTKNKNILEYGCGVGTLTKELSKNLGEGKLYVTDISKSSIIIAEKRINVTDKHKIKFIHDEHILNRVHPGISKIDIVVSFGLTGALQDLDKILKELNNVMKEDGRLVFVDYINLFKVLPNASWHSDKERLQRKFSEAGFPVHIKIKKDWLWDYLIIEGIKSEHDVPYV